MNGIFIEDDGRVVNYWYFNNLASDPGIAKCDGDFHVVMAQFDGATRRLFYDDARWFEDPSGSAASINTNFCLGGEGPRGATVTRTTATFATCASGAPVTFR